MFIWKIYCLGMYFGNIKAKDERSAVSKAVSDFGGNKSKYKVVKVYDLINKCEIELL